jgi:ankyrin repeat protein
MARPKKGAVLEGGQPGAGAISRSPGSGSSLLGDATRVAARQIGLLTVYVASLTALMLAVLRLDEPIKQLFGGRTWILVVIAALPLALTMALVAVPEALRRLRVKRDEARGISGRLERPGYFRITPYEDNPADRSSYTRADEAHREALAWLSGADQPILYLTGLSGTGKSSLLAASVLPELEAQPDRWRVVSVPRHDPLVALRAELLRRGAIWKKPPVDVADLPELVARAADYVRPARLLLVFDQFEGFLIVHERDPERLRAMGELLALAMSRSARDLSLLLVLREDYKGKLHALFREVGLPPMRQNENWKEIPPFFERDGRDFLARSGLTLGPRLMDEVFAQVAQVEETEGLVRPITLNMIGLILARTAPGAGPALPRAREGGGLIVAYLRQCIRRADVQEHAQAILRRMITAAGTKQPRSVRELAEATRIGEHAVTGCLLGLGNQGLVRRIDERENVWEISHDFVARLLAHVLSTWRVGLWRRARPWALAAALAIWAGVYLVVPAWLPWYRRLSDRELRRTEPGGPSWLHRAARHEDPADAEAAARYFLGRGADVQARDAEGRTPLHEAAALGNAGVARALLEGRADVEAEGRRGERPLHLAAQGGELEVARLLLDYRADVGARDQDGNAPLHLAAQNGRVQVEALFLDHKADIEAQGAGGLTPLGMAVDSGQVRVVRLLLERGAAIEAKDRNDKTALDRASGRGPVEVVTELLAHGADIAARDASRHTPLHEAAMGGQVKVAEILLDHKADIAAKDNSGQTPLHEAAMTDRPEVAAVLLDRGAALEENDGDGATPLIQAAAGGKVAVAKVLLDRGAKPEARDLKFGGTSLYWAATKGKIDVVRLLLDRKVDVDAKDLRGIVPIGVAARNGDVAIIAELLAHGADLRRADNFGNTPLIAAAVEGRLAAVRLLLDRGADREAKDGTQARSLHWAAFYGKEDVVRLLLDRHAEVEAKDREGNTPLITAATGGRDGPSGSCWSEGRTSMLATDSVRPPWPGP